METSDLIAFLSAIVSIFALIYAYRSNTKKYELVSQYRNEVLAWYKETVNILIFLRDQAKQDFPNKEIKNENMAKLSSLIEVGRFYFPNINKGDNFGNNKPLAFQGYRNLILDILVYSYQMFEDQNAKNYIAHLVELQRNFTSYVFEVIDPKEFIKQTKKHTDKTFVKELTLHDYLKQDANNLKKFIN